MSHSDVIRDVSALRPHITNTKAALRESQHISTSAVLQIYIFKLFFDCETLSAILNGSTGRLVCIKVAEFYSL